MTPQDFIDLCLKELGQGERPAWSNHVPYWDEIGLSGDQGQPWCGAWVTAMARRAGIGNQINYIYCPTGRQTFINRGKFSQAPIVGSPVFFEWEHDNLVDHTGLCIAIHDDGTITTIEGNTHKAGETNDQVEIRIRPLSLTRGFGVIDWAGGPAAAPAPTPPAPDPYPTVGNTPGTGWMRASHPTFARTNGWACAHMQAFLGIRSDGIWGPVTDRTLRAFQAGHGLTQDGACGPLTWSQLHPQLAKGAGGPVAGYVQEVQREVGVADDGEFGGITDAQVRDYQRTHGLVADGVVGPATYRTMLGA
jgi:hypothetical protein